MRGLLPAMLQTRSQFIFHQQNDIATHHDHSHNNTTAGTGLTPRPDFCLMSTFKTENVSVYQGRLCYPRDTQRRPPSTPPPQRRTLPCQTESSGAFIPNTSEPSPTLEMLFIVPGIRAFIRAVPAGIPVPGPYSWVWVGYGYGAMVWVYERVYPHCWETVITVRVIGSLVKTSPGKKGAIENQPTNKQFCCLLKILQSH